MANKQVGLRELDIDKHLSPETLGILMSGDAQKLREALIRPDVEFLRAQAKERRRQLFDAVKYPDFYRRPPEQRPAVEPNVSPYAPTNPGSPVSPGGPQAPGSPGGIMASAALRDFVLTKIAGGEEEESQGSLSPEAMEQLVKFIAAQAQGTEDTEQAEEMGDEPNESDEKIYRLLAALVGGADDETSGDDAACTPVGQFPAEQADTGIGEDYSEPALEDLEQQMNTDVDSGGINSVYDGAPAWGPEKKKGDEAEKKNAFKHGFFLKVAEAGLKPSEFEEIFRMSFEKAAEGAAGVATALTGGAVLGKGLELGAGGVKSLLSMGLGAGKLGLIGIPLLATILGGVAGGSAYYMTRPDELSPDDIKHIERLALYKRLSRRAKRRTRKEEPEAEATETRGDDAHRKLIPMPATPNVEV